MDDTRIIAMYRERDEHAIEETAAKYGRLCLTVATNLLASPEDANECVNDTWLALWNSIPPEKPRCLRAYLAKLSRNIALDYIKHNNAEKRSGATVLLDELAECIPDPQWQSENELKELLREFVNGLDPETQRIFLRRYWYNHSIKELAKAMHCSENRITGILFRTRKKLRNYLEKEGYRV